MGAVRQKQGIQKRDLGDLKRKIKYMGDKKCTSKKKDKKEDNTVKETEECTVQRFKMFRKNETN